MGREGEQNKKFKRGERNRTGGACRKRERGMNVKKE